VSSTLYGLSQKGIVDMEIVKLLKEFFEIENIDRKKVKFSKDSIYRNDDQIMYFRPELIIVKNENGKILFNRIVDRLKNDLGSWKEKGINYIEGKPEFPYFILTMDMITCGIRFGCWARYGNDISSLSNEILLEEQEDDYINFKNDIERLFGI
jgi:hypothetical protein